MKIGDILEQFVETTKEEYFKLKEC